MKIRTLARRQVAAEPFRVWNAFVDLLAMEKYDDLTPVQRAAHCVFWYEHEVQNGGHFQYFENRGTAQIEEVITALQRLGARCQADVLSRAAARHAALARPEPDTVDQYVVAALDGEFDDLDREFHACRPSLVTALEGFLAENQAEFVVISE